MNNLKDTLDVILGFAAIIGIVLHIAKTKSDIEKAIDNVKDDLSDKIANLSTEIKVNQARQDGKREMTEYFINDIYSQIHHKFYRCWDEIQNLQGFLQQYGFIARAKNKEVPPAPKKIKLEEI